MTTAADTRRLVALTIEALDLADRLELTRAAIHLNAALVELDGIGRMPQPEPAALTACPLTDCPLTACSA